MSQRSEFWAPITKTVAWVGAWLASIEAAQVQVWVAIVSGLAVGALAALNLWVTFRDKVLRDRGMPPEQ